MPGPFTTPVAESVPLENKDSKDNDFKALNVQEGLEEIDFRRELKDPTGFQNQSDFKINYNSTLNEVQIIPQIAEVPFHIYGCKYSFTTTITTPHPTNEGFYIFYLEKDGTIANTYNSQRPFEDESIRVAASYYDATNNKVVYFANVASIMSMDWATSRRLVNVERVGFNTQDFILQNFVVNGNGSNNSHAQIGVANGDLYHKDLVQGVRHSASPTLPYEQDIQTIAKIPIFYKLGPGVFRKKEANSFPLMDNPGGRILYNQFTGSTWQLTEAGNNKFVAVYLFATLNIDEPIVGILGTSAASTPKKAIDEAARTVVGFPNSTFAFLKVLIFQTATSYTNTPKARLAAISDGSLALSNDRYQIAVSYGGNANSGRYLEIPNGDFATDERPILVPEDSFMKTITVQTASNFSSGDTIGFFEIGNLSTPRLTVNMAAFSGQRKAIFEVTEAWFKDEEIVIQVTNGSINKPLVRFWIETLS